MEDENFIHNKFGYCYYAIPKGGCPIIFNIYIEPEFRRCGHSRKLLNYVINEIKDTGYIGDIEIEAIPREDSISEDRLISFYKSLGLRIVNKDKL